MGLQPASECSALGKGIAGLSVLPNANGARLELPGPRSLRPGINEFEGVHPVQP